MLEGKVKKVSLLAFVLFMSACSQTQPQVKKDKSAFSEVKELKQQIDLTKLILSSKELLNKEEKEVLLKVKDEINRRAKELLGHKYIWGATSPYTYDCSGFTRKVFGENGFFFHKYLKY